MKKEIRKLIWVIIILILIFFVLIPLIFIIYTFTTGSTLTRPAQITEQLCDAENPCSEGLECFSFPDIGLRCAQPNPCSYFKCPFGTQCLVAESYPAKIICNP